MPCILLKPGVTNGFPLPPEAYGLYFINILIKCIKQHLCEYNANEHNGYNVKDKKDWVGCVVVIFNYDTQLKIAIFEEQMKTFHGSLAISIQDEDC